MLCNVYQDNKIDGCSCTDNNSESNLRISSSVASFLVWGGGGGERPPNVPTEKKNHVHVTHARASEASSVPFYYLWYGAINDSIYTDKILTLRQIYEYASERSERA